MGYQVVLVLHSSQTGNSNSHRYASPGVAHKTRTKHIVRLYMANTMACSSTSPTVSTVLYPLRYPLLHTSPTRVLAALWAFAPYKLTRSLYTFFVRIKALTRHALASLVRARALRLALAHMHLALTLERMEHCENIVRVVRPKHALERHPIHAGRGDFIPEIEEEGREVL